MNIFGKKVFTCGIVVYVLVDTMYFPFCHTIVKLILTTSIVSFFSVVLCTNWIASFIVINLIVCHK